MNVTCRMVGLFCEFFHSVKQIMANNFGHHFWVHVSLQNVFNVPTFGPGFFEEASHPKNPDPSKMALLRT